DRRVGHDQLLRRGRDHPVVDLRLRGRQNEGGKCRQREGQKPLHARNLVKFARRYSVRRVSNEGQCPALPRADARGQNLYMAAPRQVSTSNSDWMVPPPLIV